MKHNALCCQYFDLKNKAFFPGVDIVKTAIEKCFNTPTNNHWKHCTEKEMTQMDSPKEMDLKAQTIPYHKQCQTTELLLIRLKGKNVYPDHGQKRKQFTEKQENMWPNPHNNEPQSFGSLKEKGNNLHVNTPEK